MFEYFWLPCMATVAAVALSAILFIEFLKKKRPGQIAGEGRADSDSAKNKGTTESADPTSTSPPLNETATSSGYDYEVFLSFRGPDTRAGFTDFLYTSLVDAGIRVFKDDEDHRVGEEFPSELLQAINQSKISIPIFSKGYASSVWCLKELAQMVECKKTGGQKIMPIFYDVAPSEVRHQIGGYGEAFRSHIKKKRYNKETMREWKTALQEVSFINGWDLHSMANRQEGEFARKLTQKVFSELKKAYLVLSDCLVSVDNHVDVIMEMIGAGTNETRIIGIHGMGGIGKTTVAKMIYNKLSNDFENCCFLHDIRERSKGNGIQCLQNQLISDILKLKFMDIKGTDEATQAIKNRLSNKRVLLLLDDVEGENHIHPLVGKRDWLGKGSKIIITTRNKDILEVPEVDCSYELSCMDRDQSLQLFSKHAFRRDYPLDEYIDQSTRVIAIARGLPLTLEVIGSLLCRTNKEKWDLTLKKLENVPHATVQSKLRISYDALDIRQQDIFLDIACLFIGYHKDIVVYFWDESKYPEDAMEVLQNMSLIKMTENNQVWMHDQLRDLGREIVRQKSEMKIEKQSRVWDPKEGLDLLGKHKGNKEVEALCLMLDHQWQHRFTYEGFENLSNLRFLRIDSSKEDFCAEERLLRHESPSNVLPTNENSDLLPRLRWLSWHNIPPTFKIKNFSMENVVFLDLSFSEITHDWKGWGHMKVMKNLKVLNLSYCDYLERTPIFSAQANLERLILRSCSKLVEIDGSICQLKRLVSLDVQFCEKLQRLPDELGNLESLIELNLSYCDYLERTPIFSAQANLERLILRSCSKLVEIDGSICQLKRLVSLDAQFCEKLQRLPDELGNLESLIELNLGYSNYLERTPIFSAQANLERLILRSCHKLVEIDGSICQLKRLVSLDVQFCEKLQRLPDELGNLESLIELNIGFTGIEELPDSIRNLKNLAILKMSFTPVSKIPDAVWTMEKLDKIDISSTNSGDSLVNISNSIYRNQSLKILRLRYFQIYAVPKLPESLIRLELHKLHMKMFPDLSCLVNLKELDLQFAQPDDDVKSNGLVEDSMPQWIGNLTKLESLRLESPYVTALRADLSLPPQLKLLHLKCPKLRHLSRLLSNLSSLYISNCKSLHSMGDLSNLENLSSLKICCTAISEIQGLDCLENLQELELKDLEQVEKLPDLSNLNKLRSLRVHHCDNLVEIQGDLPQFLEKLQIFDCRFLWKLPNLSSLTRLLEVSISRCGNLVEIQLQGELPQSLVELRIDSWKSLWKLPNLSSLMGLREVSIGGCGNLVEIHGELPQSLEILEIETWRSLQRFPNLSSLMGLREVSIGFCGNLVEIPGELPQSLEKLKINFCESLRKFPNLSSLKVLQEVSIGCCGKLLEIQGELPKSLEKLKIKSLRSFRKFPNLSSLTGLREVSIGSCDNLVEIQGELPQSLEKLKIDSCESLQKLPNLSSLTGLREVSIGCCGNLVEINGELPQSLKTLEIDFWRSLWKLPNMLSLTGLEEVYIGFCGNLVEIQGELPHSLKKLQIKSCESLRKLPNLSSLMGLRNLYIGCCGNLIEIPGELPQSLEKLGIDSWRSLRKFPNLSSLMGLREVSIDGCDNLVEIEGELPQSLKTLKIYSCESLRKLPNLSSLMGLREVSIGLCGNLVNIHGELPQSLKALKIHSCGSLRKLPNLSSLMGLGEVSIVGCDNLVKIQGELPQSLEILKIYFCESLRKLPDLSNLIGQGKVQIIGCGKLNLGEDNESESQSEGEDHESEYDS